VRVLFEELVISDTDLHVLQLNGRVWVICETCTTISISGTVNQQWLLLTGIDHAVHHTHKLLCGDRRWLSLCEETLIPDSQFSK
jgi:hypothetical protein